MLRFACRFGCWVAALPLLGAAAAFGGLREFDREAVDRYVESRRAAARVPGLALAVVMGDEVLYLRGYGTADGSGTPVAPETPFVLGSLTKSFTALAVMQLVEQGRIDLDVPVREFIPWFRVADEQASREITVRHLLNQTSGLSTWAGRRLLTDFGSDDAAIARHVRALADVELSTPPGTRYEYSNANYTAAGFVVQAVAGLSYEEYVRRHIFSPLEMRHSFASQHDAEAAGLAKGHRLWFGYPVPASLAFVRGDLPAAYLCSSARDMARWLSVHLGQGKAGGVSVVSAESMLLLLTPPPGSDYAMGWRRRTLGSRAALGHTGEVPDFRAQALLVPSENLGIVVLMNANSPIDQPRLLGVTDGVAAIVLGEAPPEPATGELARFAFFGLAGVIVGQLLALGWALRVLARWRDLPGRRPRSPAVRALYILVPQALDLALVTAILGGVPHQFDVTLRGLLLYQPDAGWLCVGCAGLAAVWGAVRTVLFLRRLRDVPA